MKFLFQWSVHIQLSIYLTGNNDFFSLLFYKMNYTYFRGMYSFTSLTKYPKDVFTSAHKVRIKMTTFRLTCTFFVCLNMLGFILYLFFFCDKSHTMTEKASKCNLILVEKALSL